MEAAPLTIDLSQLVELSLGFAFWIVMYPLTLDLYHPFKVGTELLRILEDARDRL